MQNEGVVQYKFKSEKEYDIIKFQGNFIEVGHLKRMIEEKCMLRREGFECFKRQTHYDFNIYELGSNRKLTNELEQIPSNCSVIVERVPIEFADITYYSDLYQKSDFRKSKFQKSKQSSTNIENKVINFEQKKNIPHRENPFTNVDDQDQGKQKMIQSYFTKEEFSEALDKSRFFVIRSSNHENIMISRQYSEWATTKANEGRLNSAFNSINHVFLIFTVSKQNLFMGFARMESPSTKSPGRWTNTESIRLGGCFKIRWITYASLSFQRIKNLTNPYNNNEPVKNARDCAEIEPNVGKELCKMFELAYRDPQEPPPSFILEANGRPGLSQDQVLIQQLSYVPNKEIEEKGDNLKQKTRSLITDISQQNQHFLERLSNMNEASYKSFVKKMSENIDSYFDRQNRDKRSRNDKDKDRDRDRDRNRDRDRDSYRDRDRDSYRDRDRDSRYEKSSYDYRDKKIKKRSKKRQQIIKIYIYNKLLNIHTLKNKLYFLIINV